MNLHLQYSHRQEEDGTWTVLSFGRPMLANYKTEEVAKAAARNFNKAAIEAEINGENDDE